MLLLLREAVKLNNLLSVFHAVADEGCETRTEIAASAELSIVTVGKACEAFLDVGVFVQIMKQTKSVGRNAGIIRINPTRNIAVIDISKRIFSVTYYDLSLNCVFTKEHEYISDFEYSNNLEMFFQRLKTDMLSRKEMRYVGICFIVPGIYKHTSDTITGSGDCDIERIKIRQFIKSTIGLPADVIIDQMSAAASYCAEYCQQDGSVLLLRTDENGIEARLIIKGRVLRRYSPCGAIPTSGRGLVFDICHFIRFVCNLVGLDKVIIESEELSRLDYPGEIVKKMLIAEHSGKETLEVHINSKVYASFSAARLTRNYWIERLMR